MWIFISLIPLMIHPIDTSILQPPGHSGVRINPLIKRYEGLSYNRDIVRHQLYRAKRSDCEEEPFIHLQFSAHQRQFRLRLKRDSSSFTGDFRIKTEHGLEKADLSHLYSGHLQGDRASFSHGSIIDGQFEGFIQTERGRYYIEPIERHVQGENPSVHSLIYHQDDIDVSHPKGRGTWCRSQPVLAALPHDQHTDQGRVSQEPACLRTQRDVSRLLTTCFLHIHVDPWYYSLMGSQERVTAQIANYLMAVNGIYQNVDFLGIRHINFQVQDLSIDSKCNHSNPLHDRYVSIEKLLDLHSKENWSKYCLSYLLTNRDYSGELGLAWQGNVAHNGGICSSSLNTGLITARKYGSQLPLRMIHLVLAHELGHSLGSPHDGDRECRHWESSHLQRKPAGNFLMYRYASSGDDYNNDKLSDCTIHYISEILKRKKDRCFHKSTKPICGNQLVEEGEQCDVGHTNTDPCCYGASQSEGAPCQLKPGKRCSPTQGPCCDSWCELVPLGQRCRKETECNFESRCDGASTACPNPLPKANYSLCNQGMRLCLNGRCTESLCVRHNLEQCSSLSQSSEEACQLWCQRAGNPRTCSSSSSVLLHQYFNSSLQMLPPGSPCRRMQGYCDMFHVCRLVNDDGPIAKLGKAIFRPKDFEGISDWMKAYWWAILLAILTLVALMSSTVFIFGKTLDGMSAQPEQETSS
ncbi:disintegrin and metalloproteinase domain-containing protein 10-like isoform X1 [Hemiscyllium ocellatum]|uniref:disintegrin and metalloproteinase domain-containing protein 10-like isoform X1 n=1 Tax=Hemiscyllium ocellatum TaxID=170820 RepID=UPI002966A15D|nr:disintegrin and metalloproteinase domain-containing protein 10-like isoform X1 [Hemiscyllium ocellatum]